ncbi:hypothetical protein DLAC_07404 [Tieghemostelium lacteum]|uniref:ER membrane protein complex subunit 6 n=1 Tax=Tieghemostelium lacteum TaxID=361077 RepID=A0A151ZCF6_TIELA|nr:hypothetical protein DLAC_07404 [Tieghemostelium lacteum]|eukprot:KYQ91632.1 hypothetical protein DLAC_07404 [Tieghemostelium lacteum]
MSSSDSTKERSHLFLLKNAFNRDIKFTNKEITVNVHWLRQILGVILGILFGMIPLKGFISFGSFFIANALFTSFYYSKILEVEDPDFKWELFQEGFMTSFAMFCISWILFYNVFHI